MGLFFRFHLGRGHTQSSFRDAYHIRYTIPFSHPEIGISYSYRESYEVAFKYGAWFVERTKKFELGKLGFL